MLARCPTDTPAPPGQRPIVLVLWLVTFLVIGLKLSTFFSGHELPLFSLFAPFTGAGLALRFTVVRQVLLRRLAYSYYYVAVTLAQLLTQFSVPLFYAALSLPLAALLLHEWRLKPPKVTLRTALAALLIGGATFLASTALDAPRIVFLHGTRISSLNPGAARKVTSSAF